MMGNRERAVAISLVVAMVVLSGRSAEAAGRSTSASVNTILNGKGVPKSALGNDGDFYIDTRSLLLYGPKSKGRWPSPASIQGPTGPAGNDGKNGSDGKSNSATNVSAVSGAQGPVGPQGEKGEKGDAGSPGASGAPGAIGPAGPAGSAGSSGPAGSNGSNGAQGATGATGAAGAKGETGTVGPSEVTVIDIPAITLGTSAAFSYAVSSPIGNLKANNDYVFEILLRGTSGLLDLVLGADLISSGNQLNFNYQRSDFRYATYSTVQASYGFYLKGTVKVGASDSSLIIRIIDGRGETGGAALTLTGKAYITLVGSIK